MSRNNLNQLISKYINLENKPLDAIVVEGYDGVGKGKVLNELSEMSGVVPYRPDYNLWQNYNHRQIDRWKPSGFFWDIFSHFRGIFGDPIAPMLFDRGVMSGAVYNNDITIARNYKSLLRDVHVLHILVVCTETDYYKFMESRGVPLEERYGAYSKYVEFTRRYLEFFEESGVDYMVYDNYYDEEEALRVSITCEGCGHYNYGWCRHPEKNQRVKRQSPRCLKSTDKEVQDINGNEMQCV